MKEQKIDTNMLIHLTIMLPLKNIYSYMTHSSNNKTAFSTLSSKHTVNMCRIFEHTKFGSVMSMSMRVPLIFPNH